MKNCDSDPTVYYPSKPVSKPVTKGSVKAQEYIGGLQPCEIRTKDK